MSESKLEALHFADAPRMISKTLPGPMTREALALSARFDTTMMMNVVITAANYRMVSVALNALGVQLDPGDEKFPTVPR